MQAGLQQDDMKCDLLYEMQSEKIRVCFGHISDI